jgi:GAF domain-containing protein
MSGSNEDTIRNGALSRSALDALQAVASRVEIARRLEFGAGEAVLRSIVDATVALFEAEASSIALYDPAEDRLVFKVAAGEQGQGVVGLSVPTGEGLVGYVYTTGQALALSDVLNDARFGRSFAEQTSYVPRGIVAVPLVDDEGTIGVLEVLDKRDLSPFTLRDVELASIFATQATVAIRSSRVERETAQLLGSVLNGLLGDEAQPGKVDELVALAISNLAGDDQARLWTLADHVARLRRADPGQVELVTEILDVLARHTERPRAVGRRTRSR